MKRHEAAMAIALINMISKKIAQAVKLESIADIEDAFEIDIDVDINLKQAKEDLTQYISQDKDPILYNQILCMVETSEIRRFADGLVDVELQEMMIDLSDAIDAMREIAIKLEKDRRKHPYLINELCDKQTEDLLSRAVGVGLLTKEFQPAKGTKIYQLKLIAYAVNIIKGTKVRSRWCHFEKQWNVGDKRLSKGDIPITRGREIYKVAKIYPEVDFNSAIKTRAGHEKTLESPLNPDQAIRLCKLLKKHEFLDKNVNEESFLAVQGLVNIPPHPINWSGSAYSLAYFMKALFSDRNANLWNMTVTWFTVNNETLNHGTFKTKSHVLIVHPERYEFIPLIDRIISKCKKTD